jgi:hypothetical protein
METIKERKMVMDEGTKEMILCLISTDSSMMMMILLL